jgi:Protein of unknown function (DUF3072)
VVSSTCIALRVLAVIQPRSADWAMVVIPDSETGELVVLGAAAPPLQFEFVLQRVGRQTLHVSNVCSTVIRAAEVMDMGNPQHAPNENAEKDTSQWVTGDEPMTGPQRSYLHTLAQEAGREVPDDLSKAHASELIDELQERTGRGS